PFITISPLYNPEPTSIYPLSLHDALPISRAVKTLLDQKRIPPLKRTLHFLWVPEHFGTVAWLTKHPEVSERAIAALNLDMVGENLVKTNSRLNIARTPDSLPSFLNDLVENVAEQVEEA